ncbi:hypothetical protein Taro_010993 [Colocasia esculenta]|uniref:RRM domain-containing protein n=1 Tax=Colocasia esculenta TaxID=4460 RepID=A0A843UES5_COLES|nr:hypothetical protein [Colocasia esculenta]
MTARSRPRMCDKSWGRRICFILSHLRTFSSYVSIRTEHFDGPPLGFYKVSVLCCEGRVSLPRRRSGTGSGETSSGDPPVMAAMLRAAAAARSAATAAAGGLRRMSSSIFADLDLKREPDLPPNVEPSTKLFIAGLNKQTTSDGLREAFSKFGQVVDAHVVTDRVSGLSKGFGFVRYATIEEAEAGKKGLDGKFLEGWVILADFAKPKPPPRAATENLQSPLLFHGINRSNAMGGNPQSAPFQSQPSSHPPVSYQSPPSHHSPSFNEHNSYNSVAPVNPHTPPVQDINLNNVPSGNSQSPPPYQSRPSYQGPPSNQSQTSYQSPLSNGHYSYNNAASMNPQNSFPHQNSSLNNSVSGSPLPSFSSNKSQPSYQRLPADEHNNYHNSVPVDRQSPPSYQHDYNTVPGPSYQHIAYSNQLLDNPAQSPTSYQHNSYNTGSMNHRRPPFYQYNSSNGIVPEGGQSPPSSQHGKYDYQTPENPEAEPAYQYGG